MDKIFEREFENLKEMIQNPAAFHKKVAEERERIIPMLIKAEEMSNYELIKRAKRIKPLIRLAEKCKIFRYDELINAKDSRLYFVKPTDVYQSYLFNFDVKTSLECDEHGVPLEAKGLREVARFICYHRYGGYYGCLRPGVDEVLQQLPEDIDIEKISAFELVFASSDVRDVYDSAIDRHVSTVILYALEDGLPEQIKEQHVIVRGVSYPFDLLCYNNGKFERVPMDKADVKSACGIFPFEEDLYISLCENNKNFRDCFKENEIPFATDMYKIFKIRDELNVVIKSLGYPILEGSYFVKEDFMPEEKKNYIFDFFDGKAEYFGEYEHAKFRMCCRL